MLTRDFENISSKITPLFRGVFPSVMLWIRLCVSVWPFDQGMIYKFYLRGKTDLRVCLTFQLTFPEFLREREVSTFTRDGDR